MEIKRLFFILFFLSLFTVSALGGFTVSAWAMFEERPSHARAWGMGGAFTAVADDSSAIYFNPAGLGQLRLSEVGGSYTRIHGNKDQELMGAHLAQPLGRFGTLGAGWLGYGSDIYSEDTYTLSYGKRIFREAYLGASFKDYELDIKTIGKGHDYGGDIGFLYRFMDGALNLGLFGGNINKPNIGEEDLPQRYAGGIAYRPDPNLTFAIDYHYEKQEEEENDEFRLGIEYHWLKYLFFRSGVANNPSRWTVGLGLRNRFISFDYAYLPHHNLDETHLGTLTFRFGGPRKPKEVKPPEPAPVPEEEVKVPIKPEKVIEKININTASRTQLETLPGIGPIKAMAIIIHRPYEKVEYILRVPGIRPKTYEAIKGLIIVRPEMVPVLEEEIKVPVKPERVVEKININTASRAELETLPGISPAKALAIIMHRPYEMIEDLRSVPGIGAKRYEALKDLITIEPEEVEVPALPKVEEIVYIVVEGDTLSKIAKRYLGDAKRYKEIAEYKR